MYNFVYSYQEFPKWTDTVDGMVTIQGDFDYTRVYVPRPVIYGEKDGIPLHIRFAFPVRKDDEARYPLIIHCKGSGWNRQNLEGLLGDYVDIIKAGYAVAFVEYRTWQDARYPAMVCDLKSAAAWILENREELPVDFDNIFLAGDSSGGHTAIMAYLTWGQDVLRDEDKPLPELKGLLDFYGVTDVKKLSEVATGLTREDNAQLVPMLFETPEDVYTGSCSCYIDLPDKLPPVIIMHGNKDRLVPLSQSIELYSLLRERGCDVEFYMIDGADHSSLSFWGAPTKQAIIDFLKKHTD